VSRPFESELPANELPLVLPSREDVVRSLRRVASDLDRLARVTEPDNGVASDVPQALHAVHLAIVQLGACA
jgi:hypothetical protein